MGLPDVWSFKTLQESSTSSIANNPDMHTQQPKPGSLACTVYFLKEKK